MSFAVIYSVLLYSLFVTLSNYCHLLLHCIEYRGGRRFSRKFCFESTGSLIELPKNLVNKEKLPLSVIVNLKASVNVLIAVNKS